jgi:hypothetical protein
MQRLPASHPAENNIPQFNTLEVAPGAVTSITVYAEPSRKKELFQAVDEGLMYSGLPSVTPVGWQTYDMRIRVSLCPRCVS